jgi:hypothetical protein
MATATLAALLALAIVALPAAATSYLPMSAITPGTVNRTSIAIAATYDVTANLGFDAGRLWVTSKMIITNRAAVSIDRLALNSVPARLGGMVITRAVVDGRDVTATIDDQTIRLSLGGVLAPGSSAMVRISYNARFQTSLTGSRWLFTKANGIVNAYRWIPWISRARPFDRPNHGDPFVTPNSSSVIVRLTTDRAMLVATSGRRISSSGLTQTFRAENVRDFNFTASPYYKTLSGMAGTTRVVVFHRSSASYGQAMLDRAIWALTRFTQLAGAYPHPTYTVAQSAGGYGMESPAHTWLPPVDSSRLAYLLSHETAHQWFYGMVGNDQAREPFADEAMADHMTRYALNSFRSPGCSSNRLDLTIYDYSSSCYYELIYIKGGNVISQVRAKMGNSSFWSTVRAYVQKYRGKLTHTSTLLQFLDDHTSRDLRPIYRVYFPSLYP